MKFKRVAVVDDGIGMTANVQVLIKSNKVVSYQDTQRIGLSIVKEMLLNYKILLNVISYPDKGSKLFFDMRVMH
jgi:signal transduction histidine kinase